MKKVAILAVIVAGVILAGCASKAATEQTPIATTTAHHDYKGETVSK